MRLVRVLVARGTVIAAWFNPVWVQSVEQHRDAFSDALLFVLARLHPIRMHQKTTISSDPSACRRIRVRMSRIAVPKEEVVPISDPQAEMPPSARRFVKVSALASTPVLIGALILSMFIDFWIVLLIVVALTAIIFIPLSSAIKREMQNQEAEADHGDSPKR